MIKFGEMARIMGGTLVSLSHDRAISHLFTDSRKNFYGQDSLFFAIKTEKNDGHRYIQDLYDRGCRYFVTENQVKGSFPLASFILVDSAVLALQKLAGHHREGFRGSVIGITGSNGKTMVKEWLYQLTAPYRYVVKSPGSFNSQIGVPLSLWNINSRHELAIIEAGISQRGEMARLASIISPETGIFTNIGSAHDEGFVSLQEKIEEKAGLFVDSKKIIHCADHLSVSAHLRERFGERALGWGTSPHASIHLSVVEQSAGITTLRFRFRESEGLLELPFREGILVENACHCIAFLLTEGFSVERIQQGLRTLQTLPMRMQMRKGRNGNLLLDDTYNSDWVGLQNAMNLLHQQSAGRSKMVILSDILQTGLSGDELYGRVTRMMEKEGVGRVVAVGHDINGRIQSRAMAVEYFPTTEALLATGMLETVRNTAILVKGARSFQFERIIKQAEEKSHLTRLEVNLTHLLHNLSYYRSVIRPNVKVMVMVKALAYGSGAEIPSLLQHMGVDYLGVAYTDEGIQLRNSGIRLPIMVMNAPEESFGPILDHGLEPEVFSLSQLDALIRHLSGRKIKIHLKIESGMNRLGLRESEIPALLERLKSHQNIEIASIFSHLAGADDPAHDEFTHRQAQRFYAMATEVKKETGQAALLHLTNSAGLSRFPMYHFHMVRLGIGLHGISSVKTEKRWLLPVESFKTSVSQIHDLEGGDTVGYGRVGRVEGNRRIATIAVGYADGFRRSLSAGKGEVVIQGRRAPVVGNVCMDMTMVDVTGLDVKEGDEVILFGDGLEVEEFASRMGTIPYEVLTGISERVKRVYVYE